MCETINCRFITTDVVSHTNSWLQVKDNASCTNTLIFSKNHYFFQMIFITCLEFQIALEFAGFMRGSCTCLSRFLLTYLVFHYTTKIGKVFRQPAMITDI